MSRVHRLAMVALVCAVVAGAVSAAVIRGRRNPDIPIAIIDGSLSDGERELLELLYGAGWPCVGINVTTSEEGVIANISLPGRQLVQFRLAAGGAFCLFAVNGEDVPADLAVQNLSYEDFCKARKLILASTEQ